MMKEVLRSMETGLLAEIGLLAYLTAFVLIVIWAMTMKRASRQHAKNIPLNDEAWMLPDNPIENP